MYPHLSTSQSLARTGCAASFSVEPLLLGGAAALAHVKQPRCKCAIMEWFLERVAPRCSYNAAGRSAPSLALRCVLLLHTTFKQTSTGTAVLTSSGMHMMTVLALRRAWVARVAEMVPDKNQTVRTAVTAVLQRVYADIDPECLVRYVATAPRQAQHHLLQALLSALPDLPQQVCSPSHPLHELQCRRM